MRALIDGDIVLHRVGYTTDNDPEYIAKARVDEMIDGILLATNASEFEIYLSDSKENNFRYLIWPEYKANRVQPRPVHYEAIKEYLIVEWGARIAHGMEADDSLGINQDWSHQLDEDDLTDVETVICSIDKDLLQIPGSHYNFVKNQWEEVTQWEGLKWFYQQLLIGDVSDNISGCKGIGPVKSGRIVGPIPQERGEWALWEEVFKTYQRQIGQKAGPSSRDEKQESQKTDEEILSHILLMGRLLKIRQTEGEVLWVFPSLPQTVELKPVSTLPKQEEHTQSTEPMRPLECGSPSHGKQTEHIVPDSVAISTSARR